MGLMDTVSLPKVRKGFTYVCDVSENTRITEFMGIPIVCDPNMPPQFIKVVTNKNGKEEYRLFKVETIT